MGEIFGDFDYFSSKICRSAFLQKIKTNTIQVSLATPLLGLERGQRVNLKWYDTDELVASVKDEKEIETNIPDESKELNEKSLYSYNKQVSGQYLIIGTSVKFYGWENGWRYILTLARPANMVNRYIGDDN